jgi:hypothetical protein
LNIVESTIGVEYDCFDSHGSSFLDGLNYSGAIPV